MKPEAPQPPKTARELVREGHTIYDGGYRDTYDTNFVHDPKHCPKCDAAPSESVAPPEKEKSTCEECGKEFTHYRTDACARFDFCCAECEKTYHSKHVKPKLCAKTLSGEHWWGNGTGKCEACGAVAAQPEPEAARCPTCESAIKDTRLYINGQPRDGKWMCLDSWHDAAPEVTRITAENQRLTKQVRLATRLLTGFGVDEDWKERA